MLDYQKSRLIQLFESETDALKFIGEIIKMFLQKTLLFVSKKIIT